MVELQLKMEQLEKEREIYRNVGMSKCYENEIKREIYTVELRIKYRTVKMKNGRLGQQRINTDIRKVVNNVPRFCRVLPTMLISSFEKSFLTGSRKLLYEINGSGIIGQPLLRSCQRESSLVV